MSYLTPPLVTGGYALGSPVDLMGVDGLALGGLVGELGAFDMLTRLAPGRHAVAVAQLEPAQAVAARGHRYQGEPISAGARQAGHQGIDLLARRLWVAVPSLGDVAGDTVQLKRLAHRRQPPLAHQGVRARMIPAPIAPPSPPAARAMTTVCQLIARPSRPGAATGGYA